MKVAAVQHDIVWEDPAANLERLAPRVARAAGDGARLVVLAEMFATGFSMAAERIAEPPRGPSTSFLVDQAAAHGVWTAASVPTRLDGYDRPVNCLVLAGPAGELHRYPKRHPFSFAGEHHHYAAGREVITVAVEGLGVTPFVCYDLRFADDFWEAAERTHLYLVVANWPDARRHHWRTLLVARAIENQAWVVGVNRVGAGDGLAYAGDTMVIDPLGAVVAAAPDGEEAVVMAEVDPAAVADVRARFPFLPDRVPPTAG